MSNYILLSLCILFLIKTSLTLIKAEVLAFQARHFSFLTIPCVPGKKASKRIEGKKKSETKRDGLLLHPNQTCFSSCLSMLPCSYWPSYYFTKLSPYVRYLASGRKWSRWKNYLLHFHQPRESFMFLTWITASCSYLSHSGFKIRTM